MSILDDVCTDKTLINSIQYTRIAERNNLVELDSNSGSAVARNTAMDHSKGRYWAFLDSDDKWLPEKLSTQLAFMQKHDYAFTYTKYVRMKENGELTNGVSEAPKKLTYKQIMKHCENEYLT